MEPLTPNTSAFLSYLNTQMESDTSEANPAPTSLPPSAFFPPPNDTAENTPSSNDASPEDQTKSADVYPASADSETDSPSTGKQDSLALHKRKAGHGPAHPIEEDEEDDSGSEMSGHEDKRQHGSKSGHKGGRKSGDGNEKGGKEMSKAARRKEQNRAAQKAFRERREAKVKDLEAKVAELEAKSYGTSVENENLRGILKRLQEENVALKQSAFTFQVPLSGSGSTPPANNPLFQNRKPSKPPTPPLSASASDDPLRSINDLPALTHRASSGTGESPDSLVSLSSNNGASTSSSEHLNLFDGDTFNAFAAGGRPFEKEQAILRTTSSSSGVSPITAHTESKSDLDALWASFYPNEVLPAAQTKQNSLSSASPTPPSFSTPGQSAVSNAMAWRDPYSFGQIATSQPQQQQQPQPQPQQQQPQQRQQPQPQQQHQQLQSVTDWAGLNAGSVDDFLSSLSGGNSNDNDFGGDDDFNAQLQSILGASGGQLIQPQMGSGFSPTNYLNMSPSPLVPLSNGQSPASGSSGSAGASPESSGATSATSVHDPSISGVAAAVYGSSPALKDPVLANSSISAAVAAIYDRKHVTPEERVYIEDENGKIVKPSDVWMRMGMSDSHNVETLVIEDLCEQMRSKATCRDGQSATSGRKGGGCMS
ncbi:hypothetical protein BCR39DRAFT_518473 [Naematelia encephala]|uniref:BZIP domain-containing protein n=1 Tax=Naematelia encephala TaxID=71784 RepID=A0A1Y2BH16_9TREE|nr:hypothetical protein BCR39DRAFT_518473 [Naematelia encephala]